MMEEDNVYFLLCIFFFVGLSVAVLAGLFGGG